MFRRTWVLVVAIFASVASAGLRRDQVDAIVRPAVDANRCMGVAVGLIDAHGRQTFGYGRTEQGGTVPKSWTVFEIGSVTKTFTATLLAEMSLAGEVRLDQSVKVLLPAGVAVPQKDGVPITLLHLATQSSGLPWMPDNLQPADQGNPYADYSPKLLYAALGSVVLDRRPGEQFEYSNLGMGLLGHALALKAHKSYENLLIDRICRPLGMNSTRLTLNESMKLRLAYGHVGPIVMPNWDFDALAGAGAIRSTADDMLIYLAAELGLADTPLAAAMKMTQARRAAAGESDIGMAWFIGKRTGARWQNGQTGGYHSFVAFVPDKKVGVVVLSNSATDVVDILGTQLLEAMLGEKVQPLVFPTTTTTSTTRP